MRSGIIHTRVERRTRAALISWKRRVQKIAEERSCSGRSARSRARDCERSGPSEIDFDAIVLELSSSERIVGRHDHWLDGCDDLMVLSRSAFGEKSNAPAEPRRITHD